MILESTTSKATGARAAVRPAHMKIGVTRSDYLASVVVLTLVKEFLNLQEYTTANTAWHPAPQQLVPPLALDGGAGQCFEFYKCYMKDTHHNQGYFSLNSPSNNTSY